ncbi:MAG: hypothetical protein L6R40_006237 [Gallowayella cf. fulva]|nr:MAG: hypothetical protein L6R40_006237 [Xanthomendoza cf. fulva]
MSKANVSQQKPVRAGFRPQCYIAKHKAWASKGLFYIEQRANLTPIDNLTKLKAVEDLVASAVEVRVPFNNPITGFCAFTHKAGIHGIAKAILANPATYEIINPADFGIQRYVHFASRLTGWNAIKSRCDQLGINMTDAQIKQCTAKVKAMADVRKLSIEDPDIIINQFYQNLKSDQEKPLLDDLTQEEKEAFAKKENELNGEPEMQKLDKLANAHTNGVVTDHVQA